MKLSLNKQIKPKSLIKITANSFTFTTTII